MHRPCSYIPQLSLATLGISSKDLDVNIYENCPMDPNEHISKKMAAIGNPYRMLKC